MGEFFKLESGEIRDCKAGPSAVADPPMKAPFGHSLAGMSLSETLPPPNTKRWVIRRKAAVVAALQSGGITIEEACRAYRLTEEELLSWTRAFEIHGLPGLRATRIQQYRVPRSARRPRARQ